MKSRPPGDIPDPGERGVPRYSPRPFPTYRYVPGVHPHPVREPTGHSYQPVLRLTRHAPWHPDDWKRLDDWLAGIDLFNFFYFWEAHETWEGLWATAERGGPAFLLLQGLIQVAAALLKVHMAVGSGARRLSSEGLRKLDRVAARHATLMGLDVGSLSRALARYFAPLEQGSLPVIGPAVPVLRLAGEARCNHLPGKPRGHRARG